MMLPNRIQLQRTKGWRKPEGSILVSRPSKWGNPFKVGDRVDRNDELFRYVERTLPDYVFANPSRLTAFSFQNIVMHTPQVVVDAFTWWLIEQPHLMVSLKELRGHDLACWCPLDQPCHADALIELANETEYE